MPEPATDLWFRVFNEVAIIDQLARALFEARLPSGFLVSHFAILNHLVRVGDGRTPLELTRAFQVPKATMTHTLGGLERASLIEPRRNPEDGRSKRVWITASGRTFREEAIAGLGPDVARLSAVVPEDMLVALLPGLEALRRALDADRTPTQAA